jgi:DNA-binding YbaB/EbfC family protein
MKGQLGNIMKQAQEMQANMQKLQEELASIEVTGSAGAGMVEVVMTCRHEVRSVKIDPNVYEDDREMLEDLVSAAMNDAVQRVERTSQEKMSEVTGGMNLPPGLNLG